MKYIFITILLLFSIPLFGQQQEITLYKSYAKYLTHETNQLTLIGCSITDTQMIYSADTLIFTNLESNKSIGFKPLYLENENTLLCEDSSKNKTSFSRRNLYGFLHIFFLSEDGSVLNVLSQVPECMDPKKSKP